MSKQSTRIGVILLVGIVAIAATLLVRRNNKPKIPSQTDSAFVLAADAKGAITQTVDGTTRGYDRDGNVKWTQKPVSGTDQAGNKTKRFANFFCAGSCPRAYGNSALAGRNQILQFGFGGEGGMPVGPPLNADDIVVRGVPTADTLLIREPASARKSKYVFVPPPKAGNASNELSTPVVVSGQATVSALASDDGTRIAAVVDAPDGGGELTTIDWYARDGAQWKPTGQSVSAGLTNACFSGDGEHAALSGPETTLMNFGGGGKQILPLKAQKMACSFSSDGVTFSYWQPHQKQQLVVVHFSLAGQKSWDRRFPTGNTFNSREGTSDLVQVTTSDGTLLLNAKNGATVSNSNGSQAAFPGRGGNFVTAGKDGTPAWVSR